MQYGGAGASPVTLFTFKFKRSNLLAYSHFHMESASCECPARETIFPLKYCVQFKYIQFITRADNKIRYEKTLWNRKEIARIVSRIVRLVNHFPLVIRRDQQYLSCCLAWYSWPIWINNKSIMQLRIIRRQPRADKVHWIRVNHCRIFWRPKIGICACAPVVIMIIRHFCHSFMSILPDFVIGSCTSDSQDVVKSAMFIFETVCVGFVLVSSYKLYQLYNVYFSGPPNNKEADQVMTKPNKEVLSIALHHGVNADGHLYRLKRGTKLRLVPGPSLIGRHVALYSNYPVTGKSISFVDFCVWIQCVVFFLIANLFHCVCWYVNWVIFRNSSEWK